MAKRKTGKADQTAARAAGAGLAAAERDRRLYDAVLAFRAGELEQAETLSRALQAALQAEADGFFPVLLLRGMIAARTGRAADGIELLRAAVALDARSADAHNELAGLLRAQSLHAEAIAHATRAVRLQPTLAGSHNNLGLCCLAAERVPEALAHFGHAIALQPDVASFHHNAGLALRAQAREFDAIDAFRRALSLDPDHAEALSALGQLLYQHGQPIEAARCYERAAQRQPLPTIAAIQRAEALMQRGQASAAEDCLREALAADPSSDLGHQVLGVLLQRRGRFEEAERSLARAIELEPRRVSAFASLVAGRRMAPTDAPLLERMRTALADATLPAHERSRLHYALGKAHDDLGQAQQAIHHFDRANEALAAQMRRAGRSFDRAAHAAGIERLIAGYDAAFFARHAGQGSGSELPVLIVGMPRSGTTLVEQILSSHREAGAAGELSFWTDRQPLDGAALAGALAPGQLQALAAEYLALLEAMCPGAPLRVTDKMPANFLVLGLVHLALPGARIVHCRRDPLDTCLSIYSTPVSNVMDFAHERADLVFFYEQYARLMAHWRRVLPAERLFELDYETLVAEPERVTRALVAFCGLTWDEACLQHERNAHIIMTPSLWQARQPVYRDAVARWRRYEPWLGEFRRLQSLAEG